MQIKDVRQRRGWRQALWWAIPIAILFWARKLVWQASVLMFLGLMLSLLALPLMKRLERRFSPGLAASLSMAGVGAALVGGLTLLVPFLIRQGRQLAALVPGLLSTAGTWMDRGRLWLAENGLVVDGSWQDSLLSRAQESVGVVAPSVLGWLGGMAGGVGRWMLASAFAFYFLRDRRRIAQWLILLLPVSLRGLAVRILREIRRETTGYLRGQLLVSGVVGALTAIGLLFCGIPAWLMLGILMGVLELIPYVGPVLGGVLVALFSLPEGFSRMLWALGVVVVVQQAEGSLLSPQLLSEATRLHPIAVILCITLGGSAAGITGILLSVPLLLCVRASLRVLAQRDMGSA